LKTFDTVTTIQYMCKDGKKMSVMPFVGH